MRHADDTALLSTNRHLFVTKCNFMLHFFKENSLSLNLSKSSFMIINPKTENGRCDIELDNGFLEYKSEAVYLGAIISDTGSIKEDINKYVDTKRANVTIKYNNFVQRNTLAPLNVKFTTFSILV